jgi:hypothetical protein
MCKCPVRSVVSSPGHVRVERVDRCGAGPCPHSVNGGFENSSRVFGPAGWDMQPPLTVAIQVSGRLNDPMVRFPYHLTDLS